MATLAEQRRAIASGMASSRAPTGEAQRRAIGNAMIERRTGKAVAEDINRLTGPRPQRKTLTPIAPVGALPPARGRGVYKAPATGAGGGGIASPLTEISDTRTFYDSYFLPSTDGLSYFEFRPTRSITMTDANNQEVVMQFAEIGS